MWEENRLLQSGVVRRTSINEDEEKDLVRVQIIVMDIKPPFLDGRMVLARCNLFIQLMCSTVEVKLIDIAA
jgi:pre-mRNA-splicing factor ATP-dependent RNA helicase DHX38/PRP16